MHTPPNNFGRRQYIPVILRATEINDSFHSPNFDEVVNVVQQESNILINWFHFNCMQAKPEKFQAIAVGKKSFDKSPIFQIGTANISCDEVVKTLEC